MALSQAPQPRSVAIYIRWSTDEQTEGTSLETQKERCILYARSQGWDVREDLIFVDDGYSGGSLERPALTRLRGLIQEGRVDCVVIYSLDRLSRNLADTVQLVQTEWVGRCLLRTASQPISTDENSPTGQLIFNVLASFAEFERGLIRERTYSGSIRRAKEGKYPGGPRAPYGYRRSGKGELTIDSIGPDGTLQGPAAVVRRIFELAASGPIGMGPARIARIMEAEGHPSPKGGPWWGDTVRRILAHPVYVGDVTYGRMRYNAAAKRVKGIPKRQPRQEPLVQVSDACPAIVPRALWDQVQELVQQRAARYGPRNVQARNRSLLAGIARCKCGGTLSIFKHTHGKRYYRCSRNFLTAGGCDQEPGLIDAEWLERVIGEEIKARYGTAELKAAAIADAEAMRQADLHLESVKTAISRVEQRLKAIDAEVARARRAARKGEIRLSTFEELRQDAEAERAELEEEKAELESKLTQTRDWDLALEAWRAYVEQVDAWELLDVTTKREILSGLLRELVVYRRRGTEDPPEISLVWEMPLGLGVS